MSEPGADKYAGKGLAVVGVNTPEFEFEGNPENVRRALNEMVVRHPVAVDNDYAVWHPWALAGNWQVGSVPMLLNGRLARSRSTSTPVTPTW